MGAPKLTAEPIFLTELVEKLGNHKAAAEALGVSPTTVSEAIREVKVTKVIEIAAEGLVTKLENGGPAPTLFLAGPLGQKEADAFRTLCAMAHIPVKVL